jgi:hypothetical protein
VIRDALQAADYGQQAEGLRNFVRLALHETDKFVKKRRPKLVHGVIGG